VTGSAERALFTDPRRLIADGALVKVAKKRQLAELLGVPQQPATQAEPMSGETASRPSGGFDGGARRSVPVPETHEQWLTPVLLHARAHRASNF